jgi:preprotein translocase subunit SecA
MNKQRQVIYNLRRRILHNEGIREEILTMVDDLLEETVLTICDDRTKPSAWNLEALAKQYQFLFKTACEMPRTLLSNQQRIFDTLREQARKIYSSHAESQDRVIKQICETYAARPDIHVSIPDFSFARYEQETFLQALDHLWNEHLHEMDHLREGIGLRGYAQKNPLHEYQREAFILFEELLRRLREGVVRQLYYWDAASFETTILHFEAEYRRRMQVMKQMQMSHAEGDVGEDGGEELPKSLDEQRARLREQRKARRKRR